MHGRRRLLLRQRLGLPLQQLRLHFGGQPASESQSAEPELSLRLRLRLRLRGLCGLLLLHQVREQQLRGDRIESSLLGSGGGQQRVLHQRR